MKEDKIIVVDDCMLLGAMRRMKDRGEITIEQYVTALRRARDNRIRQQLKHNFR